MERQSLGKQSIEEPVSEACILAWVKVKLWPSSGHSPDLVSAWAQCQFAIQTEISETSLRNICGKHGSQI